MRIYGWQREGLAQAEMARRLGRDRGTISRELRRNAAPAGYLPDLAHRRYQARRHHLEDRRLRQTIVRLLERGLSPEQISGRLWAEQGATVVNHETIYRFVYESALGRQEKLYQYLRRGKKKRTRRQGRRAHASPIAQRRFIDARPPAATQRTEIGHWESDSLLFGHEQALNVLVDRFSRFTVVTRLRSKLARDTYHALVARLAHLPHSSVTANNGSENADHLMVSQALAVPFYFCHPYHSWEKGPVENTNGLIRRYLPRDTDLNRLEQDELDAIAAEFNHRPRKCLGFRTPHEVLFDVFVALSY